MRSVLLVTYTFPPQYDVSARRAAKLCKYLPSAGWQPVVLTKDWAAGPAPEDRRAYALASHPAALDELRGVEVVRTPYYTRDNVLRRLHRRVGGAYADGGTMANRALDGITGQSAAWRLTRRALSFFSPLFGDFPDAFRGWVDSAVDVGVKLVRDRRIDAISSLCPPASAHVAAAEISRRTGIPWVAQFDDLFSFHLESQRRRAWRWYADRAHRRWMRRATFASAITPAMLSYVERTYGLGGDVVMVGFDPDDSPSAETPDRDERPTRDRMQLVYTGSVYLDDHRPEILFEALDGVLAARAESAAPLEVVFVGTRCDAELRGRLANFPRARGVCTFIERLPPDGTLRMQRDADALVLFNYTAPTAANGTLSFPAKTFEYLNAGRPILALPRDPGGWGDTLLESTGAGVTADTAADVAAIIDGWLGAWCPTRSLPYNGNREAIARYAVPRQATNLAALLDRAVAGSVD